MTNEEVIKILKMHPKRNQFLVMCVDGKIISDFDIKYDYEISVFRETNNLNFN